MYQYQVSFQEAIKRALDKYCCFTGRASVSEYWWFFLFTFLVGIVVNVLCNILVACGLFSAKATLVVSGLVNLALFLPSFGLLFRRLHDTGKSGWYWLVGIIPLVGWILLIIWLCKDSQPTDNQYGPVPNLMPQQ